MNTKRNLIQICLLGAVLLSIPAVVQAQFAYTNADGSIYTYSTNTDRSITIVAYAGPPWAVIIPTNINGLTVTSIGESAFYLSSITSVNIPNTVTNIGDVAFAGCHSLTSVKLPNSVISIGYQAFVECFGLTSVTIPNSVINIGDEAFDFCSSLTNVTISNGVSTIGEDAFAYCLNLTNVMIPQSVTKIWDDAFVFCTNLTAITVDAQNSFYSSVSGVLFDKGRSTLLEYPAGKVGSYTVPTCVTDIGNDAFYGCDRLASIIIPDGVTNIETGAFNSCTSLTDVTIPVGVTTINDDTFNNCSGLTNVTIPQGVMSIGNNAFLDCVSLLDVTIPETVTNIGVYAFNSCVNLTKVALPNSVLAMGFEAFANCSNLVSITISSNVTSLGDGAFTGCPNLKSVFYNGNAPQANNYEVFDNSANVVNYYLPGTTGWNTWYSPLYQIAPWLPTMQTQTSGGSFGSQSNQFGFNINWASGQTVVVEASANLVNWQPVQTNTLTTGSAYFTDPQWTNYPSRFYRLRSP